jgi:hypothetical protein
MNSSFQGEDCADRHNSPARVEGLYPGSQTNELLGRADEWERVVERIVEQFRGCDIGRRPNPLALASVTAHRGPTARTTWRTTDGSPEQGPAEVWGLDGVPQLPKPGAGPLFTESKSARVLKGVQHQGGVAL